MQCFSAGETTISDAWGTLREHQGAGTSRRRFTVKWAPAAPEGRAFAGALAVADLIDEYRLQIPPLVLGQGKALFAQLPESRHLNLVQAIPFPSGTVVHIYQPQRS